MRPALAALALCALAACVGPAGGDAQKVEVGGDVFWVRINGEVFAIHNFATGVMNQTRLFTNAQIALAQSTPCAVTDFRQEPGVNTYVGALDCTNQG
jgi:hypothetical protein